ncbi:iron-containing alcohol dehydrogenase [Tuwongella immobilis]|uniref:Uncharacterized protein n=1 Tax=Tuwongella immobilis TaxID=692036 RepID=A0A6C2YKX7_9BACT|nr:iron-containing alcohol dehydrogenase [Tuwongella immobilis]VIP02027.1 alcohol dehydrogenase : Iron-containing alcohol dehydrogenase OS=Pirellula staleyi (strain ATCC 27377 / DSM 6068 / ICPB 4128) GN=Psta_2779 PE=4 SV=1: Fe-ADH [Tuwongella immobilis]VTS00168.1 alcohol dehydrogenase : Iron-containing alcohol dehydrogenase OS=Pirellula staleyi (strain ATCC 27377 / DSM 6068 / ICPB 4128) GN=Psta_2779 PE=4 SV=1: Fe-ADH [Tuwongella immobilis]
MRETWYFASAGHFLFGRHAIRQLGEQAQRLSAKRVFIMTDKILAKVGILEQTLEPLRQAGMTVEVFDEGEAEPSIEMVARAIAAAKSFGPDTIIGLGGGSNMDAAKYIATFLVYDRPLLDLIGDDKVPGPVLPLICIPTTAGTGSEVSQAAVCTDTARAMKVSMLSPWLRPKLALVDPLLTVTCPAQVSADSGIDALTHAIEAYTAVDNAVFPLPPGEKTVYQGKTPFGDMMAEHAIRLVGKHLRNAVRDGSNLEARDGMALAATYGGLAFSNVGVALVHAMEYPVGGATHCSHGAGNGLLLPFVMQYNLPGREREMANIAEWLGEDVSGLSLEAAAQRAIVAVEKLKADIGIPTRLRELGVQPEQLQGFAEKTFAVKRLMRVNPRFPTLDDILGIFQAAL